MGTLAHVLQQQIKISNLDAARRQLQTAIELWFHDKDPVSIHTLTMSAHQIVYDLNKKKKGPPLAFDADFVTPEYRKEANRLLKIPSNFFKHADRRQVADSIDFNPELSEGFILFTLRGLEFLGQPMSETEAAFTTWSLLNKPNMLSEEGRKRLIHPFPIEHLDELRAIPKKDFFEMFLALKRKTAV